ncbi:FecR family protein [Methylomonas sp. UP202]|uniref:FecR family protein n=1 Tax=Methylomonas sp. UP202 TaxID=3040943 RepID=UPI00247A9A4E|nr:FecR family protein [Methylomonas sp. UP202]WGS87759.1 FecR family protein [Methylomonas sp. UP202]
MTKASVSEITVLSDQAIDWVIRLHAGNASDRERRAAAEWRNRSAAHLRAFRDAERLWLEMGLAARPAEDSARPPTRPDDVKPSTFGALRVLAVAAVLAFVAVLPFLGMADAWFSDYRTGVGEQQTVTLTDGSVVFLNTDTALDVRYTASGRQLTLKRGQALFRVAADVGRPFEVATDSAVVKALGTVFEVWQQDAATRITVSEHAVAVKGLADADYRADSRVEAGNQAVYRTQTGLQADLGVDAGQVSAWQRGKLVFKNRSLAEVVAELDRYFPGAILIADAKLAQFRVSGVFPLNDADAALGMIEHILAIKVSRLTPWLAVLHG